MSFLVLLLAVWIEKFSALRHRVQRDGGWVRELHKLEVNPRMTNRPWLILVVLVLLPVALLGLLLVVLEPVAYGLLALPVHLLVVIYSLGRGDLLADLGPFRDAWAPGRPASRRPCGQTRPEYLRRQRRATAGAS